ncbi:MAG TPA: hypothetical protein VGN26_08265, partial [Armatimonadota bacterium]
VTMLVPMPNSRAGLQPRPTAQKGCSGVVVSVWPPSKARVRVAGASRWVIRRTWCARLAAHLTATKAPVVRVP